jgi:hypothetical protein
VPDRAVPMPSPVERFAPRPTPHDLPDPADGPGQRQETAPRHG